MYDKISEYAKTYIIYQGFNELRQTITEVIDEMVEMEYQMVQIDRVLNEMQGVANRSARFKCCMTLLNPEGKVVFAYTGVCEGSIIEGQRGVNGFGYDPIFLVEGTDRTMAELSETEKNKISHRGKALNAVLKYLKNV